MHQAAPKIAAPQLTLAYATVESRDGDKLVLCTAAGRTRARAAASCLLVPAPGDQVLLSEDNFGRTYVLAVLERPGESVENRLAFTGPTRLEVAGGDLTLTADTGIGLTSPAHVDMAAAELRVHAARAEIGLDETRLAGRSLSASIETIRTVARRMDSFVAHWVQRMSSCFRYIREHDETQAASARQLVEGTLTVQTGNSVHTAEGHVKIDAEQIHLG
ncbi:DUF3540 domain-containing protein [Desulfatitalea tepidiphila]|uniref:DUF3540 domain-containing protein n=1 Tax=Desulfatitalea tepidiphila TaxID=1185843 RepID=UPI0006B409B6|nr:DUF3540 domain-containing protein [Desulfatitalea tepidiphila]